MTYWSNRRRTGTSLNTVSQGFARSGEFTRKYGTLSNRAFVIRIYTDVLGATRRRGRCQLLDVDARQEDEDPRPGHGRVSESLEYVRNTAARVDVVMVYAGMLRRSPTAAELSAGTAMPLAELIESIRLSSAYAAGIATS